jgi:hypothetical protein
MPLNDALRVELLNMVDSVHSVNERNHELLEHTVEWLDSVQVPMPVCVAILNGQVSDTDTALMVTVSLFNTSQSVLQDVRVHVTDPEHEEGFSPATTMASNLLPNETRSLSVVVSRINRKLLQRVFIEVPDTEFFIGSGVELLFYDIELASDPVPNVSSFAFRQNYPNPFNSTTQIEFELSGSGQTVLEVFDILGRKVVTLLDRYIEAGSHQIIWDGSALHGGKVSSGLYFCRLRSGGASKSIKMLLLK